MTDDRIIAGIRDALSDAAQRLATADVRDEALATFVPAHRVLVFPRKAAMIPVGRVWRLGVFLLDAPATLYATGATTRAVEPGRSNHQSVQAERRREYRAAASRGHFAPGETVNYDATAIPLDAAALRSSPGPLFLHHGVAKVRWNRAADDDAAVEFEHYLAERVGLLLDPPEGA
jgi:hypothetical protein